MDTTRAYIEPPVAKHSLIESISIDIQAACQAFSTISGGTNALLYNI